MLHCMGAMDHGTPLIATIVGGLGLAFLFGALANRLRMSPIVGYLIAGVAVGPFTPGFVADQAIANELAEIGVILLMFGVGMHFSFRELLAVREEGWPQRRLRGLLGLLLTGLVVELALMPFALYHFHKAGLYGVAANLIAIPLTTFVVMPLEALALLLDSVGLGAPLWVATGWSIDPIVLMTPSTANSRQRVRSGGTRRWAMASASNAMAAIATRA